MGTLRFILALAVVIVHTSHVYGGDLYGLKLTGGVIAVQAFYMVSGFYMALILSTKYTGRGAYRLFITNRFLRIYPIYWVVLILTVAVALFPQFTHMFGFRPGDYAGARTPLTLESFLYLLIANIILVGQDVVLFQAFTPDGQLHFTANFQLSEPPVFSLMPLPQAWTLSLELMFYILAPFLVQRRTRVLLLVIGASLAVRLYTYLGAGLYHDPWTYRFFPSELAFFVSGMVSYRLYLRIKKSPLGNAGAAIAATTVILSVTLGYQLLPRGFVTQWTYYGMLFCLLPWLFIFSDRHRMSDGWIGELSYPIYISHVLVLLALSPLLKSVPTAHINVVVCTSTVLFSLALMRFVSTPLENYRQQRVKVAAHNKPRNEALSGITRELAG